MGNVVSAFARRAAAVLLSVCLAFCWPAAAFASDVPQSDTPEYKVAFYAFANYHIQDASGARSGYGYEMMQDVSKHMQCTFSYVGYDKTPAECVEMLRNGEIDIYTAAKVTDERAEEFAISTHPAITSATTMNVKVGNTKVVSGDYSTYDGLRIGLLARHTYNKAFLEWVKQKGFSCDIVYYETPAELSNALVNDEVDALVNSYIRTPEDERTVEEFGQTPYYIMARQEDRALIDANDAAIDAMNVETPNWRTDLFNKYYGAADKNTELTASEQAMLDNLRSQGAVIRGVMDPDGNPYSWYEDGQARGIAADLFRACARELGLDCEIVPVSTRQEYFELLNSGAVDVWIDLENGYEDGGDGETAYRVTDPYLETTVSTLRLRDSGPIEKIAVVDYDSSMKEIVADNWPTAEVFEAADTQACVDGVESGDYDAALLMTYTAQNLRKSYYQNNLQVDIVPGATLELRMGVNANDDRDFYGVWEKTLSRVAEQQSGQTVQSYIEETSTPSPIEYFLNHPILWVVMVAVVLIIAFLIVLFALASRSRRRQEAISKQLAYALDEAKRANESKQNFFSKMSHDIRTPLNVVLGMTQIARSSKDDPVKFDRALDNITSEGNYLLMLINSILDVNQIEYGHIELKEEPFNPARSVRDNVGLLMSLAEKKQQKVSVSVSQGDRVVVGDVGRFEQIVMNIVSNAIKYTGAGGRIDVSLTCSPEGVCRFTCADNGIGMSREFLSHITEDYARAEDSRVSEIQGTGLGMSVVKGFTDLMGGSLSVESELGRGSAFTVEIPFALATPEQRAAFSADDAQKDCSFDFTGDKVLLAEDNELNAEIAIELLQSIGLTVDWAENGEVACERFKQSHVGEYCAVFMDMQMPVLDGIEATRIIRAMDRPDSNVPIFAMTANTFVSDRNQCIDAGMTGYIPKPIHIDEIASTLKKTLE